MKNKFFAALLLLLAVLLLCGTVPCAAKEAGDTVGEAERLFNGILAYQGAVGEAAQQALITERLAEEAGVGAEWYILALAQCGDYDFTAYQEALLAYLEKNPTVAASSSLKYALCLAAVGSTDGYIRYALDHATGAQGLMSWVFGLHLLNNDYPSATHTAEGVVAQLLAMQCEGGGWAVTGTAADVDATAMTLQALAPHRDDPAVQAAIDKALARLSAMQLAGGDYASYGTPNPESTAQVLVALSALGVDAGRDNRFIKNGNTLLTGLAAYRLADGSFCHKKGEGSNATATVQVFYAMVAYGRLAAGRPSLYLLDKAVPQEAEAPKAPASEGRPGQTEAPPPAQEEGGFFADYKGPACLVIVGLAAALCLLLWLSRKRNYKNFLALGLAAALAVTLVCITDIRSPEEYYHGNAAEKENIIGTVTLSISCHTVAGKAAHIPADGVILPTSSFSIAEGDTVYTILTEAARQYRFPVESSGSGGMVYISGIRYLSEFDFGDLSGWVYTVNGVQPSCGAGAYRLADGDVVVWQYTCALGEDIH